MENWQKLTREELDHQCSPSKHNHQNLEPDESVNRHIKVLTEASTKAKTAIPCELAISYGDTTNQKLDIFAHPTLERDAPVFVYVHGGYWKALSREMSSFMAETLAGAAVLSLGYDLAPDASMEQIVRQITNGVDYACNWAKKRGSSRVYLCGHSAGGHLVTIVLAHLKPDSLSLIKGVMPVSGVFDLRPLVNSYVNDPIRMSLESAWENSPMKHVNKIVQHCKDLGIKVIVPVGQFDPPMFIDQSKMFYKSLSDNGVCAEYILVENVDHFQIIERLSESDYVLTTKLKEIMDI